MNNTRKIHIAIFASGTGTNAQMIINHFIDSELLMIALIVCNKPQAGVLNIASKEKIPALIIEKERYFKGDSYLPELEEFDIDFIVLAGFLWKIPSKIINAFAGKIINIHPALLPKYGGKGMFGKYVHEMVIANKEKESGITIHYVDELYDHGRIILQATCAIEEGDTPASLARKIHVLEHIHYPSTIEKIIRNGLLS